MKKWICIALILPFLALHSCEDVIDVDLPETDVRLVIEGLIRISGEGESDLILIKLTETAPFFDLEVPLVSDAKVELSTSSKNYPLTYGAGFYSTTISRKETSTETFELRITYKGEEYRGSAKMIPTVPVDDLKQGSGSLFSGNEKELIVSYTDPPETDDYYLFDLDYGFFLVSEDSFYQGNPFSFSYFYEDLEAGDRVTIRILGIDKNFYDYMNIVISQTGQDAGGPFESPPAVVRGNIRNITNPENYPLGYFAIARQYGKTIELE